ncbi:hypothetical protein BZA05DRAFT_407629 [Tricharina praecox]|uniref:uncharacterized protein n=1 Tax=Tricharina praecox TaxID=43433 RepID=UPI00221F4667|nr:uncharacterized protein BZA05DRAFT_407629 [Tricharina praecox]KAI5845996.1 hypothetical protein BZA05DRAFT_407629 [Tricharina praecox]
MLRGPFLYLLLLLLLLLHFLVPRGVLVWILACLVSVVASDCCDFLVCWCFVGLRR